jgi:hypothetical protein
MKTSALPKLRVSASRRHLETEDGRPFFWLADTAWTLPNNLQREDAARYLLNRRDKGFNVIQIVALDPETDPEMRSAYGERALIDDDPLRPNEKFFSYLDEIFDLAQEHGLYIALMPAWGQLITGDDWASRTHPVLITETNALAYGEWIGTRYRSRTNLIWLLGGDRHPVHLDRDYLGVWRAMAEGIGRGVTGQPLKWNVPAAAWRELLMTYHPSIADDPPVFSSSHWLHDDAWLSFNMLQSGHREHVRNYDQIYHDYNRLPTKPVLDGEPNYEDWRFHNADGPQIHSAWNVRKRAYWSLFAGACGHTYGHASVWPMVDEKRRNDSTPLTWREALDRPASQQMLYVRRLVESRPFFDSVPDQMMTTIMNNFLDIRVQVRRAIGGEFAFAYLTCGGVALIRNLDHLCGPQINVWWFSPRDGKIYDGTGQVTSKPFQSLPAAGQHTFTAPSQGPDHDWVLVLDSSTSSFPPPGQVSPL